jgi:hypothetical protein
MRVRVAIASRSWPSRPASVRTDSRDGEARAPPLRLPRRVVAGLEGQAVPGIHRLRDLDDQLAALVAHDDAELEPAVVRVRPRDVLSAGPAAVHAAGEPPAEDLDERLHLRRRRLHALPAAHAVEEVAVRAGDGGHVLRLLLPPLHLQAPDPQLGDVRQVVVGRQVLGGDEVTAVELLAGGRVGQHVVLAARLRARPAVGRALGDHPGHEALPGVRDAERAVDEALEPQRGDGLADGADVLQRVLASEDHPLHPQLAHHRGAGGVVHGHLRGAVDFQPRVQTPDEPHQPDILHDDGVDPPVHALAQELERVHQLARLDEDVEREVDAPPARVRQQARLLQLVEGELGPLVTGVEAGGAQIDGVGPVGHGGANGIQGAGGREKLGDRAVRHKTLKITHLVARVLPGGMPDQGGV